MANCKQSYRTVISVMLAFLICISIALNGCAVIDHDTIPTNNNGRNETLEPVSPPTSTSKGDDKTSGETTTETTTESTTEPPAAVLPPLQNWSDQQIAGLNGTAQGWSFNRTSSLNQNLPATISSNISDLINPFAVIWQLPQPGRRVVYLTMDEGYEYDENTTEILNIALEKSVPITFFITDYYIETRPDLVSRMAAEGHLVANHTSSHPNLAELFNASGSPAVINELASLENKYKKLTGLDLSRYIRPPMGAYNQKVLAVLNTNGFYPVFWSFAYRDWLVDDQPDPDAALSQILGELHDGSVILIHAVSKTNVQILDDLIDGIRDRGYEPVALPEF